MAKVVGLPPGSATGEPVADECVGGSFTVLGFSQDDSVCLNDVKRSVLDSPEARFRFVSRVAALEASHFTRSARKAAKLSQKQLAEGLGCGQSYVSQVENPKGQESVSLSFLARVASLCGGNVRIEFVPDTWDQPNSGQGGEIVHLRK